MVTQSAQNMEGAIPTHFEMIIITSLHEVFADIKVFALHQAICLEIIGRDLDVVDGIFLQKISCGCNKCLAIFHHNFSHSIPSAQNLLENEVPKCLLILLLERVPLWPA